MVDKQEEVPLPEARDGKDFALLFEALALTLRSDLPVVQATKHLNAKT